MNLSELFNIGCPQPSPSEKYPTLWKRVQDLNLGIDGDTTLITTIQVLTTEIERLRQHRNADV